MLGLMESEWLFYGGIAVMVAAGVLVIPSVIIFTITGRRNKEKLRQKYGEIKR